MKHFKQRQIFKHILYVLLFLLLYVLQITPRLFEIGQVKPYLLIGFAVALAMFEGEFVGGIYGAFAGLLCDVAAFSLFGFNGLLLCACCIGVGLLSSYIMQPHFVNGFLFTGVTTFFIRTLQFFFTYGIYSYDGMYSIYAKQVLFTSLYTLLLSPLFYLMARQMDKRFNTLY